MAGAGWYNDEQNPDLARWFDGTRWTEHVVIKDLWEARGHAPPPPEEPDPSVAGGYGRRRAIVGAIAVVAVVVVGGVALAQDGGDDGSSDTPEAVTQTLPTRPDLLATASAWAEVSGVVGDVADAAFLASVNQPGNVPTGGTGGSIARSGTSQPTARTSPTTVRRTETITRTQTNPGPRTEVGGEDEQSVGNSSTKTIHDGYVPPPTTASTAPPATTATTATTVATTEPTGPAGPTP